MQTAQRMTQKLSLSSTFFSFSSESVSPLFKGLEAHCQGALNILSSSDQGVNSPCNINAPPSRTKALNGVNVRLQN